MLSRYIFFSTKLFIMQVLSILPSPAPSMVSSSLPWRHHVIHFPLRSTPTFTVCSTFLVLFSISVNLPKFLEFKVLINLASSQLYYLSISSKDFSCEWHHGPYHNPAGREQDLHEVEQLLGPALTPWGCAFLRPGLC